MEYMDDGNISTLLKKIIRAAEEVNEFVPFTAENFFIAAQNFNASDVEESEREEYEVFSRIFKS